MSVRVDITLFGDQVSIPQMVEISRQAEDAGLGGVWVGEVWRDSLVPLAPIVAATSTIKLGTNVTEWARTPPTLAVAAGDLAEFSGGRFTLGLGTAPKEWNEAWFDIPYEQPVRRMREYIEALRLLWTAGPMQPVSYKGEVFTISEYIRLRGPLEEEVPIHIGLTLPRMARLAGEVADGVNFNVLSTPDQLRDVLVPEVEAGAKRAGRSLGDMDIGTVACCAVSDDRAEAVQWAKHQIAFYSGVGSYFEPMMQRHGFGEEYNQVRSAFQAGDPAAAIGGVTDEMVERFALAGTPDEVRRNLSRYDGVVDFVKLYPPTFLLGPDVVLAEHEAAVAAVASA